MTKKHTSIYNNYLRSTATTLRDVYSSYSYAKEKAYNYCRSLCADYDGYDFKIIGHNCHVFSAGFTFSDGMNEYLMYITPSKDEKILLH